MKQLIESFPKQLSDAIQIAHSSTLTQPTTTLRNVLISGLGGSGIGGSIASQLVEGNSSMPVIVNKKYTIPAFVNEETLVIISSYSGNTEETVSALKEALVRNAKIVCITTGGEIASMAKINGLDLIIVPPGMPPRACLGYSLVQVLHILHYFKASPHNFLPDIEKAVKLLQKDQQMIMLEGKLVAEKLHNKIPIIYSSDDKEGIAVRFRQQINENSKMLAWHHVFPELNHNELVGWRDENKDLVLVLLRSSTDSERILRRIEITLDIIRKYVGDIVEIRSKGNNPSEETFFLIHLCDWASWYLAELREVDATEVKVIDHLKSELARV